MKTVMMGIVVLFLCSLVIAETSEIDAGFNVGDKTVGEDYVSTAPTFWDNYGGYVAGLIIVLIVVIVFLKRNKLKVTKKKTRTRKTKIKVKTKKKRKVTKKKK